MSYDNDRGRSLASDERQSADVCQSVSAATRLDTVLYALAHRHRRSVVRLLRASPRPLARRAVVDHIVSTTETDVDRHQLATTVRATHLPKLERTTLLEAESGGLSYHGGPMVEHVLDTLTELDTDGAER